MGQAPRLSARQRQLGKAAGEKALGFVNALKHTKGPFAGQNFSLRPWQQKIVKQLFGTVRDDGLRQYRMCLLMLPRKNGKSELAAAIALQGLIGDKEEGAEVYCAANDRDQASLVFDVAAGMIEREPELLARCEILRSHKRIVHKPSGSVLRAISAEAYSKHGFNASRIVYDELHAAPSRELWDVLTTSTGARAQPLVFVPTTAGYDRHSILWEVYSHACQVRDGVIDDPSFLPVIYEAEKDADWTSEKVWHKANPALGDFRSLDEMRTMAARAQSSPGQENSFRRLYLNQWTETADRWLSMATWDACHDAQDVASWRGRACIIGLDLSMTTDLTACVAVFEPDADGRIDVLPQFFVPQERMALRGTRDRVPYALWADQGHLIATPGEVINYDAVRRQIQDWHRQFAVTTIVYDQFNASHIVRQLQEEDGFACQKIDQGTRSLNSPSKRFEELILDKTLRHSGHPVLRWNVANAAIETDGYGNIRPSKKHSTERIDGVMATIFALSQLPAAGSSGRSIYEQREMLVW